MNYGWGGNTIQDSGYIPLFGNGRSRKYYEKNPAKEMEDAALCRDICPLSVFHGLVELFESRPNVCYGSYEIQIFCHIIKSLLIKFDRSIPAFLKRLLSIYDEAEIARIKKYHTKDEYDEYYLEFCETRRRKTPKHLQIMIAIFLTENFTFLTTRTIGDSKTSPSYSPSTSYDVPSVRVSDIKNPDRFSEVVINNLFPNMTVWDYTLDNNREVDRYLDLCLNQWRKYMYHSIEKIFVIKPLKAETKQSISLISYY